MTSSYLGSDDLATPPPPHMGQLTSGSGGTDDEVRFSFFVCFSAYSPPAVKTLRRLAKIDVYNNMRVDQSESSVTSACI
jgi:hypothetical protein